MLLHKKLMWSAGTCFWRCVMAINGDVEAQNRVRRRRSHAMVVDIVCGQI